MIREIIEGFLGRQAMVDPVSVGAFVAGAFGMAADAVLKGAVGEAVKDGYKALN